MNKTSASVQILRCGEMARLAGISTDTLRFYERKRLLPRPQRSANGYRQYPVNMLDRVRLIRRALAIGFGTDELANILKVREAGGAPCHSVRRLAAQKLVEVERGLRELAQVRDTLRRVLQDWDKRLRHNQPGKPARLLESLGASGQPTKAQLSRKMWLKSQQKRRKEKR